MNSDVKDIPKLLTERVAQFCISVYVASIFLIGITSIPNRVILAVMVFLGIQNYIRYKPRILWTKLLALNQFFFVAPLIFSLIHLCNSRLILLNIIFPLFFLIFSTKVFARKGSIHYLYRALNVSLCIVFAFCLMEVSLRHIDSVPEYWWNDYVHRSLLSVLKLHPSYMSLFVLVSINGNLNDLYESIRIGKMDYLSISFLLVSVAFLLLISSKMGYLVLSILFVVFVYRLVVQKKYKWVLGLGFGFIFFFNSVYMLLPSIRDRITSDYKTFVLSGFDFDNKSPASERIYIWRTSIGIIQKHPFGQFCSDTKTILWDNLKKSNKLKLEEKNAHNNFLELGLKYGFIGILGLVLFVLASISWFRQSNDFLFLGVFLIFLFFSMTESTLVRELGVIYMAFIYPMHILKIKK